jgi:hypothetical protein
MNQSISKILIVATFMVPVRVQAEVRSKTIVVESPGDLPDLARGRGEAMYLHHTSMHKRFYTSNGTRGEN